MLPSLRWSPALLVALTLGGCGYGYEDDHYRDDHYHQGDPDYSGGDDPPAGGGDISCGKLETAAIDANAGLDVEPGAGAGAFIEYESGGQYRVTTTCDSAEAGDCLWDIVVTPLDDAPVLGIAPIELEPDDTIAVAQTNSVRLLAYTGQELDGFTLTTEPGAAIHFDALLDNGCANSYLFWVGDGALRSGAPSNVIDLVPSTD